LPGPARPVRRQIYPAEGPAGQGITWQWSGDRSGEWHRYDFDVAGIIESAFTAGQKCVDLSRQQCALPYVVDFTKMTQVRKETGFVRHVKRLTGSWRYTRSAPMPPSSSLRFIQPVQHMAPAAHSAKPSAFGPANGSLAATCSFSSLQPLGYCSGMASSNAFSLPSLPPLAMPLAYSGLPYPGIMVAASPVTSNSSAAPLQPQVSMLPSR
jgi:WWE domain